MACKYYADPYCLQIKLKGYSAVHREVLPSVPHSTEQYNNNRAEVLHELTRQRE